MTCLLLSILGMTVLIGFGFASYNPRRGPLEFYLTRSNSNNDKFMNKEMDACVNFTDITSNENFIVGSATYNAIQVCENGYILPFTHPAGVSPPSWESGNNFDSPSATMIAVALLNVTRQDNWIDYECQYNIQEAGYFVEQVCNSRKIAKDSVDNGISTEDALRTVQYYFYPSYGPTADNFLSIVLWRGANSNLFNYYDLAIVPYEMAYDYRLAFFSRPVDGASFMGSVVNNVIVRKLRPSLEFSLITTITNDPSFIPTFGACISWYKVADPPQIIDKQNTFQFVLACMNNADISKCVTIFDYFEIMWTSNEDGTFLRAGVSGPNFALFELPDSNTSNAANLATKSNIGTTGVWLYELNQAGTEPVMHNYTIQDMATSTVLKEATTTALAMGIATTTGSISRTTVGSAMGGGSTMGGPVMGGGTTMGGPVMGGGTTMGPVMGGGTTMVPVMGGGTTMGGPVMGGGTTMVPVMGGGTTMGGPVMGGGTTMGPVIGGGTTMGGPVMGGGTTMGPVMGGGTTMGPVMGGGTTMGPVIGGGTTMGGPVMGGGTTMSPVMGGGTMGLLMGGVTTVGSVISSGGTLGPVGAGGITVGSAIVNGTMNPTTTTPIETESSQLILQVVSVRPAFANLSVTASNESINISDVAATCASDDSSACDNFDFTTNQSSALTTWLYVKNLVPATPYVITVNASTYNGSETTAHTNSIRFCTMPKLQSNDFKVNPLDVEGSFELTLSSPASFKFDNGTVLVVDLDTGGQLAEETFSRSDFPITLDNLPTDLAVKMTFTFSIGRDTNCGGLMVTSDPIDYTYEGSVACRSFPAVRFLIAFTAILHYFINY